MPGLNGVDATRQLQTDHPAVKVIGLSAHADLPRVAAMYHAGAMGYMVKGQVGAELPGAIRQVAQNQNFFSAELQVNNVAELASIIAPQLP